MTRGCYLGYGVNETGMNEPVESFEFPLSLSSLQSFKVKDEFEDGEELRPLMGGHNCAYRLRSNVNSTLGPTRIRSTVFCSTLF